MGGFGAPPGPPGPPGWGPPGPPGPPRKPNNSGAIAFVIIVAVVLVIGAGAGIWLLYDAGKEASRALPTPSWSYTPAPIDTPTFTYTPPVPTDTYTPYSPPQPTYSSFDPKPGDCVKNTGTFTRPRLYEAGCTPGHYRIIERIDGTTNKNRCNSTGATYIVWNYVPEYVLCLRRL